jgi:hypothetical protein
MGHIIHVTGPFSSLDYDGHIWNDSYESIGLWNGVDENNPEHSKRFEVFLGDNHYMNSPHCAVPIKKDNGKLDATETQYNNYFGSTRSTVEQAFAYLKIWTIISGVYRGLLMRETGYNFLSTAVNFCCELYNTRFTILGTKKREIRVYTRDETGVPLCPPPNLTPENLRVRLNIHNQLSRFNKLSEEIFYLSKDIDIAQHQFVFQHWRPRMGVHGKPTRLHQSQYNWVCQWPVFNQICRQKVCCDWHSSVTRVSTGKELHRQTNH